jgi:hypothetical protein
VNFNVKGILQLSGRSNAIGAPFRGTNWWKSELFDEAPAAERARFRSALNRRSEIEGGVYLPDLPQGAAVEIATTNHVYTLVKSGENSALISGHPTFCPKPVTVTVHGSTWGGSLLKQGFIGRSMHLEFRHPDYVRPIVTSRIVEVRAVA